MNSFSRTWLGIIGWLALAVALGAGPDLRGRVVGADGKPIGGVRVFVAVPGSRQITIQDGVAVQGSSIYDVTNAEGEFDLPAQTGEFLLEVVSDVGYGQADQDAMAKGADITLGAWGEINGRLMDGTKPAAGVQLIAYPLIKQAGKVTPSVMSQAKTDADGKFVLGHLVPGHVMVDKQVDQRAGRMTAQFSISVGGVDIEPGKTMEVALGGVGRPVVGKFVFAAGMSLDHFFVNARAGRVIHPGGKPADASGVRAYGLEVDSQKHFRIQNVPPGDYTVHIFLMPVRENRREVANSVQFTVPEVVGGVSDVPVEIPDIEVK